MLNKIHTYIHHVLHSIILLGYTRSNNNGEDAMLHCFKLFISVSTVHYSTCVTFYVISILSLMLVALNQMKCENAWCLELV